MDVHTNLDHRGIAELRATYGRSVALGRIFSLVEAAGCQTVVIDHSPTENEYRREREAFFTKVFSVDDRAEPDRLHFFRGSVGSLEEVQDGDERYLGYCDVRPTPERSISGALIDRRVFVKTNRDYLFLICEREFEIDFGERTLRVRAFPYVQQDGAVVRCAQAALASIACYFGSDLTGPDFTDIGTRIATGARPIPSRGLDVRQIGLGIAELGRDPIMYDYSLLAPEHKEIAHPEQIIYRFVESGIPVLIGIDAGAELHALVVVGHTFTPDSWLAHTRTSYYNRPKTGWTYHCSTNWVERFVVQDDNLGPYMLAPTSFIQFYACRFVIVPLPRSVFLLPEEAEAFAGDFLCPDMHNISQMLDALIQKHIADGKQQHEDTAFWYQEFRRHVDHGDLVLRTNLRPAEAWKRSLESCEAYPDFQSVIGALPLPEQVCVIEISWPNIFTHSRLCCGELVIDPTSPISRDVPTLEQAWLWMHVPGIIIHRNAKTGDMGVSILEGRDPIRGHVRTVQE